MTKTDLITISAPECGAKPTAYAAILNGVSRIDLRRHLKNGFANAFTRPVEVDEKELETAIDELLHDDCAWIGEYYLVEVTRLNVEEEDSGDSRYARAIQLVQELTARGASLGELCLAHELKQAFSQASHRLSRIKGGKQKLTDDLDGLLTLASIVTSQSGEASTPKDIAVSVVEAYLNCGMDLNQTSQFVQQAEFAFKFIPPVGGELLYGRQSGGR